MLFQNRKKIGIVFLLLLVLILTGCSSSGSSEEVASKSEASSESVEALSETVSDPNLQINRQNGGYMFSYGDAVYLLSSYEGPLSIYQLNGEDDLEAVLTFPQNYSTAPSPQFLLSDEYIYMLITNTTESQDNLLQINMDDGAWKVLDRGSIEQIDFVDGSLFYLKKEDTGYHLYRKDGENDEIEIATIDLSKVSNMIRIDDRFYVTSYSQSQNHEMLCVDFEGNAVGDDALLTKLRELNLYTFYVYGNDLIYYQSRSDGQEGIDIYHLDLKTLESQKIYTTEFFVHSLTMDDDHIYLMDRNDTSTYHLWRFDKDGQNIIEYTGPIEYYAGQPHMTRLYSLDGEVYLLKSTGASNGLGSNYDETHRLCLYRLDDDGLVHLYGKEIFIDE